MPDHAPQFDLWKDRRPFLHMTVPEVGRGRLGSPHKCRHCVRNVTDGKNAEKRFAMTDQIAIAEVNESKDACCLVLDQVLTVFTLCEPGNLFRFRCSYLSVRPPHALRHSPCSSRSFRFLHPTFRKWRHLGRLEAFAIGPDSEKSLSRDLIG
jgi:hypothetical protein